MSTVLEAMTAICYFNGVRIDGKVINVREADPRKVDGLFD